MLAPPNPIPCSPTSSSCWHRHPPDSRPYAWNQVCLQQIQVGLILSCWLCATNAANGGLCAACPSNPGVMGNPSTVVPHTRLVLVLVSVFYLPQFCLLIQFSCFFCEAQWRRMSFFLPGERVHRAAARQQEASQRSLWHLRFEDEGWRLLWKKKEMKDKGCFSESTKKKEYW
jgi:hypothetical protein